jgi:hypothetical protein
MSELSGAVEQLIRSASEIAAARNHPIVGTEHVLHDSFARRLLDEVGATDELRRRIEELIGPG